MDRCALFVDAGYVLADGAMAVHGTRRRESVTWDYAGLVELLSNLAGERTKLPLLRCYWYEATVEGRRSAELDTLAELPGVKLRMAKRRPGRREGVEGEIHRDLTTLARNKAVSDVMVVTAEEDLAPVLADVQDLGLRVTLLQVAADGDAGSRALRQEADDFVEVSAAHLRPYVELISGAEPAQSDEPEAALGAPDAADGPLTSAANGTGPVNGAGAVNGNGANGNGANGNGTGFFSATGFSGNGQAPERPAYPQPQGQAEPVTQSAGPVHAAPVNPVPADTGAFQRPDELPAAGHGPRPFPAATAVETAQPDVSKQADLSQQPGLGQPDLGQADQGQPERPGIAAGADLPPAGDYNATVDYRASVDYGAPAPAADTAPPAGGYRPGPHYGPAADYLPAPLPAPVSAPSREDLYAVPADDRPDTDRRPAARFGADLPPYAPGGIRDQYQRENVFREAGPREPGDRLMPVPAAAPAGSAQIRRFPARSVTPEPASGQPPLGLPAPPAPGSPGAPAQPLGTGQPGTGQYGLPAASPESLAGPQQVMQQPVAQGPARMLGGQPTGSQPSLPVAPVVSMDPSATGYGPGRGASPLPAAPRPAYPAPGGPGGNPGAGFGPAGQPPQGIPSLPGPQEPSGPLAPSGPIGLVGPGGYGGGAPGVSLADAVQSAHEEGQAFGESVARDAPALWLEAVLARKPRMPSDLEARLLQGSALPIDFLLHDEVRHALRRGFWDALERARR